MGSNFNDAMVFPDKKSIGTETIKATHRFKLPKKYAKWVEDECDVGDEQLELGAILFTGTEMAEVLTKIIESKK